MGIIEDKKKFKRTKGQNDPTNPSIDIKKERNNFNTDEKTIKNQQNKK